MAAKHPTFDSRTFDREAALKHLAKQDPKLGRLIKKIGPFTLKSKRDLSPYEYLLRSIIFQQLHGKAAATIHARVCALFPDNEPSAKKMLAMEEVKLQGAGLSRQKLAAIKDLAKHAVDGKVPDRKSLRSMSDEEIIAMLTTVRGIGRWTVEMLLIFALARTDVLAVDDFAIKKSTMLLHGLKKMPDRKTMQAIGAKWSPYRSLACWYLWRALD